VIHYLENKVGVVDFANATSNHGSISKNGRKNYYLEILNSKI
jgi:hypothetical protein